jgi:hypothetical protein
VGRFFSVDPLSAYFPWNSPYAFSENRVISAIELEGLEAFDINTGEGNVNHAEGVSGPNQPSGQVNGPYADQGAANQAALNGAPINLPETGGSTTPFGTDAPIPSFVQNPNSVDQNVANNGIDHYAPQRVAVPDGSMQWEKDFADYNFKVERQRWDAQTYEQQWNEAYQKIMMGQLSDFAQKAAAPMAELYSIQASMGGSGYNSGPAFQVAAAKITKARLQMTIVERAEIGTGNFGLGTATTEEAMAAGLEWVGAGYRVASDGTTLVSKNGLRTFRPPSAKPKLGKSQANFEYWKGKRSGKPAGNGHLDIKN